MEVAERILYIYIYIYICACTTFNLILSPAIIDLYNMDRRRPFQSFILMFNFATVFCY